MTQLLIASGNQGKLKEFQALLAGLEVELLLPASLGLDLDVAEDGQTYAENASRKALAYQRASGLISIADDTGLEVDALDGQPGLYSARFLSKPGATDAERRSYLLSRLQGKPRPWTAHFHCTVAVAALGGRLYFGEGDCPGEIIPEERGGHGFGYDSIFLLAESGLTMAEMPMREKNRLSHRARAVRAVCPALERLLGAEPV